MNLSFIGLGPRENKIQPFTFLIILLELTTFHLLPEIIKYGDRVDNYGKMFIKIVKSLTGKKKFEGMDIQTCCKQRGELICLLIFHKRRNYVKTITPSPKGF